MGLTLGMVLTGVLRVPSVQAQRVEGTKRVPSQYWEYAAITGISTEQKKYSTSSITVATICHFQSTGCGETRVEVDGYDQQTALAKAIAQLGADGWEMLGQGPRNFGEIGSFREGSGTVGNPFILYFKRLKP
jgi:hypothetical protein